VHCISPQVFADLPEQLHRLLAGPSVDQNPSFESAVRDNELAKQIMASNIELAKTYDYYRELPYGECAVGSF
jgi:hypothetical protein